MVDLLALLVTVPRDCVTLTEFLVFLMLGGGERTWGVEEEAMLKFPCSGRGQGQWVWVPTRSAQSKTFRTCSFHQLPLAELIGPC